MRHRTESEQRWIPALPLPTLVAGLAVLLALPGWVAGQTGDEPTPAAESEIETPAAEASEPENETRSTGCPCCRQQASDQERRRGCRGGGHGRAAKDRGPGQGGRSQGAGRPEARVIHFLIEHHQELERTVAEIPRGVRTRTVSQNPEIVDAVRTHVRQMVDLIHGGGRIRSWDPLFREIFDHREAIAMEIVDIEGGVEVTETSEDPRVTELIRAHAVKVDEFVARGIEAYREKTPLPERTSAASP